MSGLIYPEESNTLLGIAIQLHNELGCGFKEKVYQDAFEVLLQENKIPYEREKHIKVSCGQSSIGSSLEFWRRKPWL